MRLLGSGGQIGPHIPASGSSNRGSTSAPREETVIEAEIIHPNDPPHNGGMGDAAPSTAAAPRRDPKLLAQAKGLVSRMLFAAISTTFILTAISVNRQDFWLPTSWMPAPYVLPSWIPYTWGTSAMVMTLFTASVFLLAYLTQGSEKVIKGLNAVLGLGVKTNNRWFKWMVGYTVVAALLTLVSFFSTDSHYIWDSNTSYQSAKVQQDQGLAARREANRLNTGRLETVEEMNGLPNPEPVKMTDYVSKDVNRHNMWVRLACSAILFVLTFIYLFFAYSDEFWEHVEAAKAKVGEHIEGGTIKAMAEGAVKAAPAVGATVASATVAAKGPSFFKLFGSDLSSEILIKAMEGTLRSLGKNFWRSA